MNEDNKENKVFCEGVEMKCVKASGKPYGDPETEFYEDAYIDIQGRYGKARVFTHNIERSAMSQLINLLNQKYTEGCRIRIMPDVHAGAGCVIGFTANLNGRAVPNLVGVDIGCGMLAVYLGEADIDLAKLDEIIKAKVPSGYSTHSKALKEYGLVKCLGCYHSLKNLDRIDRSIGTLGGGNHFIELSCGTDGGKYLIIHSGSRNLGKQVAEYYQEKAVGLNQRSDVEEEQELITMYKSFGKTSEIQSAIEALRNERQHRKSVPKQLAYLEGSEYANYIYDLEICQDYAQVNRRVISEIILKELGIDEIDSFSTIHNYIDRSGMIRKGAVSARKGERLLIPINMRDGSLLCEGKGNPDWNYSAPHGAGRIMSRGDAKRNLSMDEFKKSMKGVYTTSVNENTLDEAPMAYKSMNEIIDNIHDTVYIKDVLKPLYNYKAGGE